MIGFNDFKIFTGRAIPAFGTPYLAVANRKDNQGCFLELFLFVAETGGEEFYYSGRIDYADALIVLERTTESVENYLSDLVWESAKFQLRSMIAEKAGEGGDRRLYFEQFGEIEFSEISKETFSSYSVITSISSERMSIFLKRIRTQTQSNALAAYIQTIERLRELIEFEKIPLPQ